MRSRILFLGVAAALGMAVAIGATTDLAARCRCDRPDCGRRSTGRAAERKVARQDRRAARRGGYSSYDQGGGYTYDNISPDSGRPTPTPGYNPYGVDQVQTVGAASTGTSAAATAGSSSPPTYTTRTEYRWEQRCSRGGCAWVRVPYTITVAVPPKPVEPKAAVAPAAPQPVPDPAFREVEATVEKPSKETEKVSPPQDENEESGGVVGDPSASLDTPVFDPSIASDVWLPPVVDDAPEKPSVTLFAGHEPAETPEPGR